MRFTERRLPCYARTATKPIAIALRYGSTTVRRTQSAVAMNTQESLFRRLISVTTKLLRHRGTRGAVT